MNTETKKRVQRYSAFVLFWCIVFLIGLLASASGGPGIGGGSGSGRGGEDGLHGTGTGTSGDGSGKGEDTKGDGSGKGAGTVKEKKPEAKKTAEKGAAGTSGTPRKKEVNPVAEDATQATLMVHNKEDVDEDVATIHLPQMPAGNTSGGGTKTGFFGIRVGGNDRVIFLLDTSGSMGSTTSDGSMSRIALVKRETENVIKQGHAEARKNSGRGIFSLASFDSRCILFAGGRHCHFADNTDVHSALQFVAQLKANGGTSMLDAWNTILPIIRQSRINMVCFLSDGDPGDCSPDQLLQHLRQAVPELRINTIAMGKTSELLKKIAKQHGGVYREVF